MDLPPGMREQHLAELSLMRPAFTGLGFVSELVEGTSTEPLSALVVDLGSDDLDRHRELTVRIRPFGDDQFAATTLYEFVVVMPYAATPEKTDEIGTAIALVNAEMAVGAFELRGVQISYRYSLSLDSAATISTSMLGELVPLLVFHQEHFGDYLEGVLDDEISVLILPKLLAADNG